MPSPMMEESQHILKQQWKRQLILHPTKRGNPSPRGLNFQEQEDFHGMTHNPVRPSADPLPQLVLSQRAFLFAYWGEGEKRKKVPVTSGIRSSGGGN